MKQKNPYIVGLPIEDEKHFFGRNDLIQRLMQGLRNPKMNTFLLYGPRRIGKTSLLKQLEYHLCDEDYTQIYFDLSGKSRLYLNELLYEIAQAMADACAFQPPRQENFDREGRYFLQVFLPQVEKTSRQSDVVLLFDEFDFTTRIKPGQAASEFLPYLLKHLRRFQKIKIIYCLGCDSEHLTLKSKLNIFVPIPRLSKNDMVALVRQSEADGTLLWHETAIDSVWSLTHGHPYLTQMICNIAWGKALNANKNSPPAVTADDIDATREIVSPYVKKYLQLAWQRLHSREQAILSTLVNYGKGTFDGQKLYDLLRKNRIPIKTSEISSLLRRLVMLDVIEPVDAEKKLFAVAVPLFSMWCTDLKTAKQIADKISETIEPNQKVQSPNLFETAVKEASAMERKDNWGAAIEIYVSLLEKDSGNDELRAKLHHARNQERLASRYNKALNAISCGDYENAQKLLAEVILRDPAYKEASRFLLLATTGIDANEMKQKLDHDNQELSRAKSQIVRLQGEITKARQNSSDWVVKQKQVDKLEQTIAEAGKKEHGELNKLAKAKKEFKQQQNIPSANTPQKQAKREAHIHHALASLDSLLETKDQPASKAAKRNEMSGASKAIPAGKPRRKESQKIASTVLTKKEKEPGAVKSSPDATVQPTHRDSALNETLATLDEVLDEPGEVQVDNKDDKKDAFVQTRVEQQKERPFVAEKREATAVSSETVGQNQATAFTDTAIIDAGQVEKLPDPQQQLWDSREQHEPHKPSVLADRRPRDPIEMEPVDDYPDEMSGKKPTRDSIEMGPIDENGSAKPVLREQDHLITDDKSSSQNMLKSTKIEQDDLIADDRPLHRQETHSQPGHFRARSDFRKKVLVKQNTLKEQKRKKLQAAWIAGTLNTLPVFIWVLWLWYVQPLEWGNGGKLFVLIVSVPAWLAACRFGASDKEKHITSFFALAPAVSFCFYAILTFETLRPGVPSLTDGNHELLIIAGFIYILVITIIAGISGEVASVVSIGATSGACAGTALFLNEGGAIEATLILALITTIMLIIEKVDTSSAAGVGIMAGIPAGFLLFVETFHLSAPNFPASFQASLISLLAFLVSAGLVYAMVIGVAKISKKA